MTPYPTPIRLGRGLIGRGTHVVSLTRPGQAARSYRAVQERVFAQPLVVFPSGSVDMDRLRAALQEQARSTAADLPANVGLMTVQVRASTALGQGSVTSQAHRQGYRTI